MRAVTIGPGATLTWSEHPDPVAGVGELLVAVHGSGVNNVDLLQRRGFPSMPGFPPDIPGFELAGEVVGTGPGVSDFAVGDRVMALVGGAGHAELAVVHERCALAVPDHLSWAEAGAFAAVFTTAHDAVFTQCGLALGERLLVQGAAGGVGLAAVQLGALAGASVVATVRHPDRREQVAALGRSCGDVTVVAPDDYAEAGPYDVVLELVGASNIAGDIDSLATGGRISFLGFSTGDVTEVNLGLLMMRRGRILSSTLRPRPLELKALAARAVDRHVLPLLRARRVTVPIAATYPMSDAQTAYDAFASGGKLGKIVLLRS
jgi:NADPH:quinone reductase-like Zn-dependent oxidoreductase